MAANHLIDALGGTTAVARMAGAPVSTVHSWRSNGIPRARLAHLRRAAEAREPALDFEALAAGAASKRSGREVPDPERVARTCACGEPIGHRNRSGQCRRCVAERLNADPAIAAQREAARAAYFERPGVRQAYAERIRAYIRAMPSEERERRRANGRRLAREVLSRPEVRALAIGPDARARAGRARSETLLGWCPVELRDLYRALTRKGLRAAAARAEVTAEIERRQRKGLSPEAAARHLQRLAPTYRCDHEGRQRPEGPHWRYGSSVLDCDGLIALALARGWRPAAERGAAQ